MEPNTIADLHQQEQLLAALAARSRLYSPHFWTRAFAVWGHALAAMFAAYIIFGLLALLLVGISTLVGK